MSDRPAFTEKDVRSLAGFVENYEHEWCEGEWGWETAFLKSILAKIEATVRRPASSSPTASAP